MRPFFCVDHLLCPAINSQWHVGSWACWTRLPCRCPLLSDHINHGRGRISLMVPRHVVSCTLSLRCPFTVYQPQQQRYQCMLCQVASVNSSAPVQTGFCFHGVSISQSLYEWSPFTKTVPSRDVAVTLPLLNRQCWGNTGLMFNRLCDILWIMR